MDYSTMIHKDLIFSTKTLPIDKHCLEMLPRRFARLGMLRTLMKLLLTNAKMSSRLGCFPEISVMLPVMPILRT